MEVQFTIQGGGGQFSIRRVNIPKMKIDPGVNLPGGLKYHMTPGKINIGAGRFWSGKQTAFQFYID